MAHLQRNHLLRISRKYRVYALCSKAPNAGTDAASGRDCRCHVCAGEEKGEGVVSRTVVLPCLATKMHIHAAVSHFFAVAFCRRVVSSRNFRTSVGNIKIATKYKSNLCALFPYHFYICIHTYIFTYM